MYKANQSNLSTKKDSAQGMTQVQYEGDINAKPSDGNQELNAESFIATPEANLDMPIN